MDIDNLSMYEKVRSVPESAKNPIRGGRMSGKTDISPMWRIKILTEQFGMCGAGWYYEVIDKRLEPCGEEVAAFVDIKLFVKLKEAWSMPIFGTGGSMFGAKEKNGIYVSDECYKMATTDAISVACKQLGIGADVYWDRDVTKYSTPAMQACEEKEKEEDQRLKKVLEELSRIGYSEKSICKTYKIDAVCAMSNLQIKDFLNKVKDIPSKAVI